jgi:protein TonB
MFVYAKANVEFKARYGKYLRHAAWMAALFHFFLFVIVPPITFEPYQLEEQTFELVEVPPEIEIPPAPKEIELPTVNVEPAAVGEPAADAPALPETTFDDFADMPPPPPQNEGSAAAEDFLAFDEPPVLVEFVTPEYPELARQAGFEGTVRVRVLVDEEGRVVEADLLSGDVWPTIEKAALAAALKCRFRPATQRSIPVKARVMIPFEFRLDTRPAGGRAP